MSVRGNLETMELEGLLQWLAQGKKSGTLVVKNSRDEKRLVFENGILISTFSTNPHEHVCRFLLDRELVERDRLRNALKSNRGNSLQLGRALVESGDLSGQTLQEVLEFRSEETVRDLLEWPDGNFQFLDGERPKVLPVTISVGVTPLLLRVADRVDRLRHAEATATAVSAGGASPMISHGQLALVPGADPVTDELPVISFAPAVEESSTGGSMKTSKESSLWLLIAGVATFALAAAAVFLWMNRSSAASPSSEAGLAVDTVETTPAPVVRELEAQIATLQSQLGTLLEERNSPEADSNDRAGLENYEAEILQLQSELVAARSAVAIAGSASAPEAGRTAEAASVEDVEAPRAPTSFLSTPGVAVLEELEVGERGLGETWPQSPATERLGADAAPGRVSSEVVESASSAVPLGSTAPGVAAPEIPEAQVADVIAVAGPGVKAPKIVRIQEARYPPLARRMKREGSVQIEVLVGLDGRVEEVRGVGPEVGLGFDSAALTAARGSRWEPATVNGEPSRMWATLRVDFRSDR